VTRSALHGSLRDLALADVLQLLDLGGRSGVLRLHHLADDLHGAVLFVGGRVRGAAVARGLDDAEDAAARCGARDTQEAVLALLGWRHGDFSFVLRETPDVPAQAPMLGVDSLLMEAARRADEWAQVADLVPNPEVALALAAGEDDGEPLELSPMAWALLGVVDGQRTVRQLAAALAVEPVAVARETRTLVRAGLVAVLGPAGDDGDTPAVAATGSRSS